VQLISVNVGQERALDNAKEVGKTGIYKLPVDTPVAITGNGLHGDVICDTKHHGGPDQAIYVYGAPDYAWWSERLQQEIRPGTFGENLTISEWESASARVGDRFLIGTVVLEVTAPRIPCVTLARRMDDKSFVKQFLAAERPGAYCRVLKEGGVQAGDAVIYERNAGETVSVIEMMRDFHAPDLSEAAIRRFLAAPIAIRARIHKEKQLQEILRA
jgi:MOSC domain-containing protein YiiM